MDKATAKVKKPSMTKDDQARADRLAATLRENLKRRKAQARAKADPPPVSDPEAPSRP